MTSRPGIAHSRQEQERFARGRANWLDVEGDAVTLGKTQGKDAEANKPTYVKLMGLEGAKTEAQRLLQAALDALDSFGESADHLRDLARYIVERDH